MPRASTTSDVFNAIAEPRRRAIFELLCEADHAVGDVADALGLDQPSVSKHLRVLREVELVAVTREGRHRVYSARPEALAPVSNWVRRWETIWDDQLERIKDAAERRARGGPR